MVTLQVVFFLINDLDYIISKSERTTATLDHASVLFSSFKRRAMGSSGCGMITRQLLVK